MACRLTLLALCLMASPAFGQGATKEIPARMFQFPRMRDSTATQGSKRDTSLAFGVTGANIFNLVVKANGRSTCDTTDVVFSVLLSPDGTRFDKSAVILDTLSIYGSRADTLWRGTFASSLINGARDAKLVTRSKCGTTDTTDVQVWFNLVWSGGFLF